MKIIYHHQINSAFYKTLIDRYYRQRPFILWLPVQFGFLGLVIAGYGFWLVSGGAVEALWKWLVVAVIAMAGGTGLTKVGILYRFKRRADFGTEATVTLSEDGIDAHSEHIKGSWEWAAYPRSVRFRDGILLLRRGVIRWLPDSDIQDGDPAHATELVAAKTAMRYVS